MRFPEALYYALRIKKKYPTFKLAGSVALILSGKLPVRNVSDIDFVCNEKDIDVSKLKKCCNYEPLINEDDGYTSYKVVKNVPYQFNLLVFKNDISLNGREINFSINVQDSETILHWKKKYNRPKDKKDFKEIDLKEKLKRRGQKYD